MFSNRLLFTFLAIYGSVQFSFAGLVDSFWDHCPTRTQVFTKGGFISSYFKKYENVLGEGFLIVKTPVSPLDAKAVNIVNLEDYPSLVEQNHSCSVPSATIFEWVTATDEDLKNKSKERRNTAKQGVIFNAKTKLGKIKSFPVLNSGSDSKKYYLAPRKDNQLGMVLFEAKHIYSLKKVATYSPSTATPAQSQAISLLIERHILVSKDKGLSVDLYAWYPVGNDTQVKKTVEQLVNWSQTLDTSDGIVRNNKIKVINPNHKKKSIEKKEMTEQSDEKEIIGYLAEFANDCYFLGAALNGEKYVLLHYNQVEVAKNLMMGNLLLPKDQDSSQDEDKQPSSYYDDTFTKNNISYYWTQRAHRAQKGIITAAAISTLAAMRYLVAPAVYKIFTKLKVQLEAQREKIVKGLQRQQLVAQVKRWVVTPEYPVYFVPDERQQAIANEFNHLIKEKLGMPTGLLFSGAFGDGKSTLVKYMAKKAQEECDALFLEVSSAKIAAAVNSGTKNDPVSISDVMTGLFEAIRQLSQDNPVIVFMDEIDMYLQDDKTMKTKEQLDLCHAIVTSLPDLVSTPNVYLIAAVNNLKEVSVKLLNPHRFGKNVFLDNPGQKDREILYSRLLACSKMEFSAEEIKAISEAAGPGTLNNKVFATPISRAHIVNSLKEAISEVAFVRLSENDPLREKIKNRANFALKKETMVGAKRSSLGSRLKAFFGLKASASVDKIARQEENDDAQFLGKTNSLLDMLQVFTPRYKQLFTKVLLEKIYNAHVSYAFTLKLAGERLQVLDDLREMYGSTF